MSFEYLTICKLDNFWPFEYQTLVQCSDAYCKTFLCPTDTIYSKKVIYQKRYSLVKYFLLRIERILPLNWWPPYIKTLLQLICILFVKCPIPRVESTVGARMTNIQIQNPFKIWKFWCLDLGWFYIRMIVTIATAI